MMTTYKILFFIEMSILYNFYNFIQNNDYIKLKKNQSEY